MPKVLGPCFFTLWAIPSAARVSASSQVAGRSVPLSRTRGSVSRGSRDLPFPFERMPGTVLPAGELARPPFGPR